MGHVIKVKNTPFISTKYRISSNSSRGDYSWEAVILPEVVLYIFCSIILLLYKCSKLAFLVNFQC